MKNNMECYVVHCYRQLKRCATDKPFWTNVVKFNSHNQIKCQVNWYELQLDVGLHDFPKNSITELTRDMIYKYVHNPYTLK